MAKGLYKVIRGWHGVKAGETVELSRVHPSLKSNVIAVFDEDDEKPAAEAATKPGKADLVKRLKELKVPFDARASVDNLAALLPEEERAEYL